MNKRILLRRLHLLWFLVFATIALGLSVIALIIVFAVESAWFQDSYNGTWRYGLWRVCINSTTCESWFSTGTDAVSQKIQERLSKSRPGINAWQALEIIFLFLTTATLIILIFSLIFFRYRRSLHYYLIILGTFCIWPAVSIGIAVLFVFGFSVFHVATNSKDLEWCFYVNLVAVILSVIAAFLLTIYDILFKRPLKKAIDDDDAVIERFPDLNGYPDGLNPSTFVIVRRNKKKRNQPYAYPTVLYPSNSPPPLPPVANGHITTTNHAILTPYTSVVSTQESTTARTATVTQPTMISASNQRIFTANRPDLVPSASLATFEPPINNYRAPVPVGRYQSNPPSPPLPPAPTVWNPNGISTVTRPYAYHTESYQPPTFYPTRSVPLESKTEPRVLHYYTGYDYFATIDPPDGHIPTRHHQQILTRPGAAIRYNNNATYYPSNDYLKSTM